MVTWNLSGFRPKCDLLLAGIDLPDIDRPDNDLRVRKGPMDRDNRESMEEIHLRILRVTDDLRVIQSELNCAAMQAPTDPELLETLAQPSQMESIHVLKSALDQMRHFLWFYMQVVTSDSETGEKFRQTLRQEANVQAAEFDQQFQNATDAIMLRYLADSRFRKPN